MVGVPALMADSGKAANKGRMALIFCLIFKKSSITPIKPIIRTTDKTESKEEISTGRSFCKNVFHPISKTIPKEKEKTVTIPPISGTILSPFLCMSFPVIFLLTKHLM